MPEHELIERFGLNWRKKHEQANFEEQRHLYGWIAGSNIPHDIVFDLHDDTPHEKYRELTGRSARKDEIGFLTKSGYFATYFPFFDFKYFSKKEPKHLEGIIRCFHPHPSVPMESRSTSFEFYRGVPFPDVVITVEFHPVKVVGELEREKSKKYSLNTGVSTVVQLIDHLRKNLYEF